MTRSLATKLRVLRAERRLSLRKASEETGVDKVSLSRFERGLARPQDRTLAKIAEGYDVPVEELIEELAPLGEASREAGNEISFPLDIEQIRREVAGDNWANSWATLALQKAVEGEIKRRYTDTELMAFRTQFDEIIDRLASEKETRFEEYAKAVEGFGYVSRVLEKTANPQHA